MDDYRSHLGQLITLVQACAETRDLQNCDPLLVGPDDRIPLSGDAQTERRLVRYGWLRVLFSKAEEPDESAASGDPAKRASPAGAQPAPPSTSKLLLDAERRLASDLAQAGTSIAPEPSYLSERATMALVLAGRDFRDLEQPSARDTMLEKVNNWLNHLIQSVTKWRARSAWVGRVLVWGFILAVCIALIWTLLQLERRWRIRLAPEKRRPPASTAPSARSWQLWLEDARLAASAGLWREAVHFLYWACIARLEARRLWPADRARTPREYLALVPVADPRHANLSALTRSFERIWYGGRVAEETDYRRVEEIATSLIEGGQT